MARRALEKLKYKDKPFACECDFGDCSYHEITLVGRKDSTDFSICTAEEGHGVTEDVGSVKGWKERKASDRAERPSKAQKDTIGMSGGWEMGGRELGRRARSTEDLGNWLGRSKALPEAMWILAPLISGPYSYPLSSLRTFLRFRAWYLH